MNELALVVPGRLDQLTGGYLYDRHIVEGLRKRGLAVGVIEVAPASCDAALAGLADGTTTIIDGLALPNLGMEITTHWRRLRLIGLVHHPLADETGISPVAAARAGTIEKLALLRLRGVICPSRRTAAAVRAYGVSLDRIAIVPPGTARPRHPAPLRRGPARALLCVGSLIPRKGHRVLVEALARIRDLDWKLLCIGSLDRDPGTARAVRRMLSTARLGQRIILAGEQSPRIVARAYRSADLFVLPSFHEGYGMVFAEAMAHGLPIVATTAGAIPETVPSGAGLFTSPGDVSALSRALRRLITQPALAAQLAVRSRAAGRRLPDWGETTGRFESALQAFSGHEPPLGCSQDLEFSGSIR